MPLALLWEAEATMHNLLICSANEDLLTALRAASGGGDVRLTVCGRGMEAVRALMALSFEAELLL